MPDMLSSHEITSNLLRQPRTAWVQRATKAHRDHPDAFVFLDGELYIERVKAPEIMRETQEEDCLKTATCVYLSHVSAADRHADLVCHEGFARFVATELVPWIEGTVGRHGRYFLCGLSLSGLCALFTALRHPAVFSGVVAQSPSAWWNDEWLAAQVAPEGEKKKLPERIWMSVGNQETQTNVSHPPTGLFQKTNQVDSVRRLAGKLEEVHDEVHYEEYMGGHDPACWADELARAMRWVAGKGE